MSSWIKMEKFVTPETIARTTPTTMAQAIDLFCDDRKRRGLEKRTVAGYRTSLATFPSDAWPLTEDHIDIWQRTVVVGWKPATVKVRLVAFRTFWKWLQKRRYITAPDPSEFLEVKVPKVNPRIPTPEEVAALLKTCDKLPFRRGGKRLKAIIRVLLDTGLRIAELTALKWQDVDWEHEQLTVWHGKGDKSRTVPFSHGTTLVLRKWFDECGFTQQADYVFASQTGHRMTGGWASLELRRLSHMAGLDWPVTPHKLRHYAATEMIRHGMGIVNLRTLLGHTSVEVTERYLHIAGVDVKKAHRQASPGDWLDRMIDRGTGR